MSHLLHHAAAVTAGAGAGDSSSSSLVSTAKAGGGGGAATNRELKLAYHRCIRRWHPDKFAARLKTRLDAGGESERVMERVNAVARALTTEFAKHA